MRTLVRDHHFPDPKASDIAQTSRHESIEYPVYYMIGAAATWAIPTDDFDRVAIPNPHFLDPRLGANRNAFFHRPFAGIPSGAELSARVLELLSLSFGLVTTACTVLLARALIPGRPLVWTASGVLVAGLPAFDFLSVSVTNDSLVIALSSVTLLLLVLWLKHRKEHFGWSAAIALALALLTKVNAIGLIAPYCVTVFKAEASWVKRLVFLSGLAGLLILLDGWWIFHMLSTFGDVTGVFWLKKNFPDGIQPVFSVPLGVSLANAAHEFPHLIATVFINFNTDSPWSRDVPAFVLVIGLVAGFLRAFQTRQVKRSRLALPLLAWVLVMFLEVSYWLTMYDAPGRLIYPALTPAAILAAAGWQWLFDMLRLRGALIVSIALVASASSTAWLVTAPKYRYPPRVPELPLTAQPAHVVFDDAVELIGFESSNQTFPAEGGTASLTLYWRLVHPIDIALNTFVHIDSLDPSYSADASYDGAVGGGTYPPNFWKAGEVVVDRYKFHLSANQELDNINMTPLAVHVGMYEAPPTGGILHVKTEPPDATDVGAEITHWKIRPSRLSQNPVWLGW